MKKFLLLIPLLAALHTQAALVMSEPFNYPDGTQISTAPNWQAHSGAGSTPILVTSNLLQVNLANTEDDSVLLPGNPWDGSSGQYLYASMTLNCQTLPGAIETSLSSGNYFAHFKDTSTGAAQTNGFRCRLYAHTNNAAPGMFRLGITSVNGGSAGLTNGGFIQYPVDLSTNTNYTVVMRLDLSGLAGESVLWVNPNTQADLQVTNIDPLPPAAFAVVPITYFAFRQATYTGPGLFEIGKLRIGTLFTDVAGTNTPPAVSSIASQNTPANVTTAPIPFTIQDDHYDVSTLTVSATSSNTVGLVANGNLTLGGSGVNRTITVKPNTGKQGSTTINITVSNPGGNSTTIHFNLTVGAPSLSSFSPVIIPLGGTPPAIPFIISDHESQPNQLTVTGFSSNQGLVPNGNIVFSGSSSNRTVTVTPLDGVAGITTISVLCSDTSTNVVTNSFTFTVAPQLGVLLSDNFDEFADGTPPSEVTDIPSIFPGVTSVWSHTSGSPSYTLIVTNGQAVMDQTLAEDISAPLTNAPLSASSGTVIYYGFKLKLTALPGVTGDYFIHLKDTNSTFRAKVFACTTNAAAGSFRLGISSAANAPPNAIFPRDLNLNSTYNVVVRYNVGSALTTLWINGASESDTSVSATDPQTPNEIDQIQLRQQTFEGVEWIDNLVVATSFAQAAPVVLPPTIGVISNQTVAVSAAAGPVTFTVTDPQTSSDSLSYGKSSDNTALVATSGIVLGGSGTNRTVTVTPVAGQSGFANITIYATNGLGGSASAHFLVTVGNPPVAGFVISQIYPGGGNASATYNTKFVEIFNKRSIPVSLNNWSLQYASSNGTTWSVGALPNVLVPAYSYYLIAVGPVGATGGALPLTPDTTLSAVNPSQAAGKFALCNSTAGLSGANPPSSGTVGDLVGWGGANGYEGAGSVAWAADNTMAMFRANSGCTDTDSNTNDFTSAAVSPRNSTSGLNVCTGTQPPLTTIGSKTQVKLSWPSSYGANFTLQSNTNLSTATWVTVTPSPTLVGTNYVVTNNVSIPQVFYRLRGN